MDTDNNVTMTRIPKAPINSTRNINDNVKSVSKVSVREKAD